MKVLIADDAELLRRRMVELVRRIPGVDSVFETDDCASTLEVINEEKPGIVVLDLFMPDGCGLYVLRELSTRQSKPDVYVLSLWGDEDLRQRCLDTGACEFFEKGSEFDKLIGLIKHRGETRRVAH